MAHRYHELLFTDTVKAVQAEAGSRSGYARRETGDTTHNALGPVETAFIAARDSFYLASVGESGWPYMQHRGGPPGFVRVLDDKTLGFADLRGNKQFITVGNVMRDDRVSLFFMDYPNRARLKVLGRVQLVSQQDHAILDRLGMPGIGRREERVFLITVAAFDWNCPQHITPRFTAAEVETMTASLRHRIAELEAQLASRG